METIGFPLTKERNKMSKSNSKSIDSFFEVLETATDRLPFDGTDIDILKADNETHAQEQQEEMQRDLATLEEVAKNTTEAIAKLKANAVTFGYAHIIPTGAKASDLAPTGAMFIKEYGQEEFDRVKRKGKLPTKFAWI
jgi:hypothetical protein